MEKQLYYNIQCPECHFPLWSWPERISLAFFLSTINVLGEFGTRQLFLLASQRPHLERQCSWIVRLDDPDLTGKHCATHSPPASSRPSLLSFQEIPTAWALGCKTKINFAYFDLRFSYNQQGTCLFSSNWADAHTAPPPTSPSHALGQCRGMFWASSLHGNILCFSVMSVLLAVSLTRSSHPSKPVL